MEKKIYNNVEITPSYIDDEFFKMGDSMLFDSGQEIAEIDAVYNGKNFNFTIRTQGHVKVSDTETDDVYCYPSDFPDELKDGLKNGNVDEKYIIDENNWYEVFYCVEDEDGEEIMGDSWVMECEPRDFSNVDDLCKYISECVIENFNNL